MDKLVILAGGKGVRMQPTTKTTNKILIEYQSKPIIEHCLTPFVNLGFKEIVFLTNHFAEEVEKAIENLPFQNISFSFIKKQANINSRLSDVQISGTSGVFTLHGNIILNEKTVFHFVDKSKNYKGDFLLLSSTEKTNFFDGHPFVFNQDNNKICVLGKPIEPINDLSCCLGLNYMSKKCFEMIKEKHLYTIPEDLIINRDVEFDIFNTNETIKHFEKIVDLHN